MEQQKKINRAIIYFTVLIVLYEVISWLLIHTKLFVGLTVEKSILFSQSLIFIPTVLFFVVTRQNVFRTLRLKRMHWSTYLLIPIFVLCIEPLITLLNAISMLFVDNYISEVSNVIVQKNSLGVTLLYMAVLPAIVEESAYRGVILGNFREGNKLEAILISGCLFGIMHMNFNQMAYAIVLGIILGFVIEATGSILSTMMIHFYINGFSVVLSYIVNHISAFQNETQDTVLTKQDILMSIQVYLPFAIVGSVLAAALIYAMAYLNHNQKLWGELFKKKAANNKQISSGSIAQYANWQNMENGAVPYANWQNMENGTVPYANWQNMENGAVPYVNWQENVKEDNVPQKKVRIITPLLVITVLYCIGKCVYDEFIAR